jgi:muramoyltetrapeptide carboxypeptidase
MNQTIRPPKLGPGDLVGIAAPGVPFSIPVPPALEGPFQRGMAELRRLGFRVRVGDHVRRPRAAPDVPARERTADLNALLADPEVKAIICLAGGSGANAVLPLLDWAAITRRPKIIMGYSAITALLLGITARTGLVTFHGPMVLDGFSELPALLPYTREQLERVLCTAQPTGVLRPPPTWTTDFPRDDRPRRLQLNPGWRWLRPGQAHGPLLGGNLAEIRTLVGTPYWPAFGGAILFLEEVKYGTLSPLGAIDESLAHLRMLGVFEAIAGLVVGKVNDLTASEAQLFEQLILRHTTASTFPILSQVDLGHTDPRLILPLGVRATLDSELDIFRLDEPAVTEPGR